ncbi:MAG TPA: SRPBCC family protein [Chitinophagaceae bacterium]|nr:SRPBCC family protein [Chitinophagaceae bacterium]
MTILVFILVVLATLAVLFLLAGLLMGKKMIIEKNTTINRSPQQVFDYIKYVKNHENFSVWAMMDPDMKKEYRGTDGQPGFVFAWDSSKKKNVGAGEQEIKNVVDGKSVEYELRFFRPMQDTAKAKLVIEPAGANQSRVVWGFNSEMKFPMNAMKPMIQSMLGKQLETGLQNLKGVLEKGSTNQ